MGFQLYSGNTEENLEGGKAHGWVAKICLRNSRPSKLEISVVEMCEKIFLLSEVKTKLSLEQKVFIIGIEGTAIKRVVSPYRFYGDEAWFYLTGFINFHNYRVWSGENPRVNSAS